MGIIHIKIATGLFQLARELCYRHQTTHRTDSVD